MTMIPIDETFIAGAASVERTAGGLHPWRLPHATRHLFPSPDDGLVSRAACTSGVRLRLETDADSIILHVAPLPANHVAVPEGHAFDLEAKPVLFRHMNVTGG